MENIIKISDAIEDGYILRGFFSTEECKEIIKHAESTGFKEGQARSRLAYFDTKHSSLMWNRAEKYMQKELIISDQSTTYHRHKYVDGVWR